MENIIEYYRSALYPEIVYAVNHREQTARNIGRNVTVDYNFFALLISESNYIPISREEAFLCLL